MGRKLVDTLGRRKQQTSTFSPRSLVQKPRRHHRPRPPLRANRGLAPTAPRLIHELISRSLHTTGGATACRRAPRGHASPPASTPNPKARPRSAGPARRPPRRVPRRLRLRAHRTANHPNLFPRKTPHGRRPRPPASADPHLRPRPRLPCRHRRPRPPLRANRRRPPTTPPLIHNIVARSLHATGGAAT